MSPVLLPGKARPAGEIRPSGRGAVYSRSKPGALLRRRRAARRDPCFRFRSEIPQRFIERLPQVPGCRAKSEQIQGTSQMRPVSRNLPNLAQGKLERTGPVASDFRDGACDIIAGPAAITVDQDGRTRVDRQSYGVTQSRCGIQLLQDGGRGPRHLLQARTADRKLPVPAGRSDRQSGQCSGRIDRVRRQAVQCPEEARKEELPNPALAALQASEET